jgi:hypothetical protein
VKNAQSSLVNVFHASLGSCPCIVMSTNSVV